jgi:hypothetical protein
MGKADLNEVDPGSTPRCSKRGEIDPFAMSGVTALVPVEELASSAAMGSCDVWQSATGRLHRDHGGALSARSALAWTHRRRAPARDRCAHWARSAPPSS